MEVDLHHNKRMRLAHSSKLLVSAVAKQTLLFLIVGLLAVGVWLLYRGSALGWLSLGLAAWPWMLHVAVARWLRDIPANIAGTSMGDRLESGLLRRLPAKPSPQDVAIALQTTPGARFFIARFNISPAQIGQISSTEASELDRIWQTAVEIQQKVGGEVVTSASMAAALVLDSPYANDFLAQQSLGPDDILAGADWYQHVQDVIDEFSKPKKNGGFARDWAFGYTPLLERFGVNISNTITRNRLPNTKLESHMASVDQMVQFLSNSSRPNVALIGPLGVGKMAIVEAFAEKILVDPAIAKSLRYNQIISLDASSLISAAPGRGQLEQLVNNVLVEAHKAKNIIICLDNAQLFFEDGTGSVNLSNVLLPVLEGGALRMILTMDNQRWLQISQHMPALATALNRITVDPPTRHETMRVLQLQLIALEYHRKVSVMYKALQVAYDLAERYIQEQAMPGKAIRLLESSLTNAENGRLTPVGVQRTVEQMVGVKVGSVNAVEERQTLLNMEQLIHERMIDQERAVKVVSDALRRARSGVRNQNRPIGTFLFLGPTGVGKTELSKALAAVYFGGEDHLVRIDMNEYLRAADLPRLIADAASNEHSLAAQVSRQPFSVVLLDEIEKAHPDILLTLLQVLDEGVLRDIKGRSVSFKDAIIIATSNAGAARIYEYVQAGKPLAGLQQQLLDELISAGTFKPEFINRFDETVLFTPLGKAELGQIADLILVEVNRTLDTQKVAVQLQPEAREMLIEAGYDPQFGARPMRRAVQRTVENVVARRMLEGTATPGQTIDITAEDIKSGLAGG